MALPKYQVVHPRIPGQWNEIDSHIQQQHLASVINPVLSNPIVNGTHLAHQNLVSTHVNLIQHGLGRPYQGFQVTDCDTPGINFSTNITGVDTAKYLPLVMTGATSCIISIYIF